MKNLGINCFAFADDLEVISEYIETASEQIVKKTAEHGIYESYKKKSTEIFRNKI